MKQQQVLFILGITFIVILTWIVFSILESAMSSTISKTLSVQIASIPSTFNMKVIDEVKSRQEIPAVNAVAQVSPEPSPTLTPTPTLLITPIPVFEKNNLSTTSAITTP